MPITFFLKNLLLLKKVEGDIKSVQDFF